MVGGRAVDTIWETKDYTGATSVTVSGTKRDNDYKWSVSAKAGGCDFAQTNTLQKTDKAATPSTTKPAAGSSTKTTTTTPTSAIVKGIKGSTQTNPNIPSIKPVLPSKNTSTPTGKPKNHVSSCPGFSCTVEGAFCPPGVPGSASTGKGFCCRSKKWMHGPCPAKAVATPTTTAKPVHPDAYKTNATSCKGWVCKIDGQFCPPGAPNGLSKPKIDIASIFSGINSIIQGKMPGAITTTDKGFCCKVNGATAFKWFAGTCHGYVRKGTTKALDHKPTPTVKPST